MALHSGSGNLKNHFMGERILARVSRFRAKEYAVKESAFGVPSLHGRPAPGAEIFRIRGGKTSHVLITWKLNPHEPALCIHCKNQRRRIEPIVDGESEGRGVRPP